VQLADRFPEIAASRQGRAWIGRLPRLLAECAEQWALELGEPFSDGNASLALPATLPDGGRAVLKLCFPHRESEHEGDALAAWAGDGAVSLIAADRRRGALLVERCVPGTPLSSIGRQDALGVAAGLLRRLWIPSGPPFRPLAEEAAWWTTSIPLEWEQAGRPVERELVDAALEALATLASTQGEQVLVNQDLHAGNILRAEREPWLVIDPKPLAGEREFGIAALVRGGELGHSEDAVLERLEWLTAVLGLDRERARGWALAHAIAWSDGGRFTHHVEVARWLHAAR
jgi:streptomycin 6-kinase